MYWAVKCTAVYIMHQSVPYTVKHVVDHFSNGGCPSSSNRPCATTLIGHSFFKQVSRTLFQTLVQDIKKLV